MKIPSSILFAVASLIWGSTYWAITLELGVVAPAVSVVYRFAVAAAALFLLCLVRGDRLLLPAGARRWVLLQGFLYFGVSYICVYSAEQHLVSALVAVVFALMVFWTPICSRILLGTPIGSRTWRAGLVAVVAVVLLFYGRVADAMRDIWAGGGHNLLAGVVLAGCGSIASSVGTVVVAKVREHSSNLMLTMAWSMLWGAIWTAVWCIGTGNHFMLPRESRYWAGLLYLSVIGSVVAFSCYFTLVTRLGSQKASFVGVAEPVISVLLSMQLERYRPEFVEWLGMILCLGSVSWTLRASSSADDGRESQASALARPLPSRQS